MKKITIKIEGMHCEACKKLIEMELKEKVEKVSVDLKSNKAAVNFDENKISEKEIAKIINQLGYKAG